MERGCVHKANLYIYTIFVTTQEHKDKDIVDFF